MSRSNPMKVFTACCCLLLAAAGCVRSSADVEIAPDMQQALALREGGGEGESGGQAAAAPTGTGWGTLKGVLRFEGDLPQLPPLDTQGKDAAVCGSVVADPSLQIDPGSRGIAFVLIYARKVSRVKNPELPEGSAQPLFDQEKCVFLSPVFAVRVGQPITIKNSDGIVHNTKIDAAGNPPFNPMLAPHTTAQYTFVRQLALPSQVVCSIHPWMSAYIIARGDPYYAVTDKNGAFEIADLPAGEPIEFQVWHERAQGGLQARPDWKRGRFKVTIPEDGVLDLGTINVSASAFRL